MIDRLLKKNIDSPASLQAGLSGNVCCCDARWQRNEGKYAIEKHSA
jgi:hypothetical protein